MRHEEFLALGARVFGLSVDSPAQNAAVIEKLALPFPILSDPERSSAVTPLGFADEKDPRQISRAGALIFDPDGIEVWRYRGRDYADRPHEDDLLAQVASLDLPATTQQHPALGPSRSGDKAVEVEALPHYLRGAKFAALALRSRYRDMSDEFKDDAKKYVTMTERYIEALTAVEIRRA